MSPKPLEFVANEVFRKSAFQDASLKVVLPVLPQPLNHEPWTATQRGLPTYVMERDEERGWFLLLNYFKWRHNVLIKRKAEGKLERTARDGELTTVDGRIEFITEYLTRLNLSLVYTFVARNRGRFGILDWDEAVSEGSFVLMRAINGFDVNFGVKFSTYAVRIILNGLSSASQKKLKKDGRVGYREHTDVYADEDALPVKDTSDSEEVDAIKFILEKNLADLTQTERAVVAMRFGLGDGDNLTLEQTGEALSVSKERIRQIQNKALAKLRDAMAEHAS